MFLSFTHFYNNFIFFLTLQSSQIYRAVPTQPPALPSGGEQLSTTIAGGDDGGGHQSAEEGEERLLPVRGGREDRHGTPRQHGEASARRDRGVP